MSKSRQICSTFGTMVDLLCRPAVTHHRWRTIENTSSWCDDWGATFPQNNPRHGLFQSVTIRCEKGIFLSNCWRQSNQMPGQIKGETVSGNGWSEFENVTKVSGVETFFFLSFFSLCSCCGCWLEYVFVVVRGGGGLVRFICFIFMLLIFHFNDFIFGAYTIWAWMWIMFCTFCTPTECWIILSNTWNFHTFAMRTS